MEEEEEEETEVKVHPAQGRDCVKARRKPVVEYTPSSLGQSSRKKTETLLHVSRFSVVIQMPHRERKNKNISSLLL